MLDKVLEQQPGCSASGIYRCSATLQHLPQIMLLEGLAQLSGIAVVEKQGDGGFLAAVEDVKFGRAPAVGDTFYLRTEVIKRFGRLFMLKGRVTVQEELLLEATITLGVGSL